MADEPVRIVPPSSDLVELIANGDRIVLWCLICDEMIGETVDYLNQALMVWYNHVADRGIKDAEHAGRKCDVCKTPTAFHPWSCA